VYRIIVRVMIMIMHMIRVKVKGSVRVRVRAMIPPLLVCKFTAALPFKSDSTTSTCPLHVAQVRAVAPLLLV